MSRHSRYVGRDTVNSEILKEGYGTVSTQLNMKNADTFRISIVTNLQAGILKNFRSSKVNTFENAQATGFSATVEGIKCSFDLNYNETDHTKDADFMQAIAQFLVLTFIQMFLDRSDQSAVTTAQDSVATAQMILDTPSHPRGGTQNENLTQANKYVLMTQVAKVLTEVAAKKKTAIKPQIDYISGRDEHITISGLTNIAKSIPMKDVNDVNDLMIYNGNIAAAVLLATDTANEDERGKIIEKLVAVLLGYSKVTKSSDAALDDSTDGPNGNAPRSGSGRNRRDGLDLPPGQFNVAYNFTVR